MTKLSRNVVLHILLVGTTYCIAGKLGLLLVPPGTYTTLFWPPSGVALAAMLLFGNHLWIGVALGSLFVNTDFWLLDVTHLFPFLKNFLIAISIGLGAALQAVVGANLIRKFVGYPCKLADEKEIIKFVICGIGSCLVNATWGSLTLLIANIITAQSFTFSWLTWWVGDCLGIVVFTPLIMIWTAEPQKLWRKRRYTVSLPMTLLFAAGIIGLVFLSSWDQQRIKVELERDASHATQDFKVDLNNHIAALYSVRDLAATQARINRKNFRLFVEGSLSRYPGIQALAWIEQVSLLNRASYEKSMQSGFKNFQILERSSEGQMTAAAIRPEYFPVTFIEPLDANQSMVGFDLGSDQTRLAILQNAREGMDPKITGKSPLIQGTSQMPESILLLLPIYKNNTDLIGFAAGIFNIELLVENAFRNISTGIDFRVVDKSTDPAELIYANSSFRENGAQSKRTPYASFNLSFYDRKWTLDFFPSEAFLIQHRSWRSWSALLPVLFLIALVEMFLLNMTGRAAKVEKLMNELQESEERFRLAVQGTHDGIWDWNLVTNEVYVSPRLKEQIGYKEHEIENNFAAWEKLFHPEDHARIMKTIENHLTKRVPLQLELRLRTKNGLYRWFLVRGDAAYDENSKPIRMAGSHTDITNQKRLEKELLENSYELERSNKELEQFAYVASHDLKAPLRAVQDLVTWLKEDLSDKLSGETKKYMDLLQTRVKRMAMMLDALLQYSVASKRSQAELEQVDTHKMVSDIFDLLSPPPGFSLHADASLPTFYAKRAPLQQVLLNLIENSIKHNNHKNGRVEVVAKDMGAKIQFTVADNGPGIPREFQTKVFQMFQTLHPRDEVEGTGIGLALVKKLVEQRGGEIRLESDAGAGTAFTFTWPKKQPGNA